jgi:hypothetical protein
MMRGGLISMLYSKATEVPLVDVDLANSMTLMSADIERIVTGMETGHEVCVSRLDCKDVSPPSGSSLNVDFWSRFGMSGEPSF